jgi:hypothetical protein
VTLLDGFPGCHDHPQSIRQRALGRAGIHLHRAPTRVAGGRAGRHHRDNGQAGHRSGVQIGRYERGDVSQIRVYYDRVDVLGQLRKSGTAEGNKVLRRCNRSSAGSPDSLMAGLHGKPGS